MLLWLRHPSECRLFASDFNIIIKITRTGLFFDPRVWGIFEYERKGFLNVYLQLAKFMKFLSNIDAIDVLSKTYVEVGKYCVGSD